MRSSPMQHLPWDAFPNLNSGGVRDQWRNGLIFPALVSFTRSESRTLYIIALQIFPWCSGGNMPYEVPSSGKRSPLAAELIQYKSQRESYRENIEYRIRRQGGGNTPQSIEKRLWTSEVLRDASRSDFAASPWLYIQLTFFLFLLQTCQWGWKLDGHEAFKRTKDTQALKVKFVAREEVELVRAADEETRTRSKVHLDFKEHFSR